MLEEPEINNNKFSINGTGYQKPKFLTAYMIFT
jgi:hypothetical protein